RARGHDVTGQGAVVEQGLELRSINGVRNGLGESGAHLRALAVANRLQQQLAQWPTLELEFAEDVEDLATEGLAGLFELVEQGAVHIAFAGLLGHQVPEVANFRLPNAVDA